MPEPLPNEFERAKACFLAGLESFESGRFDEAERHYLASLALLPARASTLINLAAVQLRLARPQAALSSADAALEVEPDSTDALLHRGNALAQLGRPEEALDAFDRLLAVDPGQAAAWSLRGSLLRELRRLDDAAAAYREALRLGAEPTLNGYYLASVAPERAPSTAPAAYVAALFDSYADEFDTHLVEGLRYEAHRRLVDTLAVAAAGRRFRNALDLGCGTGLCGPLVRPITDRLVGVDLSTRMLDKARALAVYDRLECAELAGFLEHTEERPDLVLAADVFIYVGDLEPVFAGVRRVMPSGIFCFSVETTADDGAGFRLLPSLRYAHSEAGVRRLAARHGFEPLAVVPGPVRHDQQVPVDGLYVCLRRSPERVHAEHRQPPSDGVP